MVDVGVFKKHCEDMNIDFKKVFSYVYSANLTDGRIKCSSSHLNRNEEQEYLFGYSKERQLYFVWTLCDNKARNLNYFTANIDDLVSDNNTISYIDKNREFSGWGEERVWVFTKAQIDIFLNMIRGNEK